MKLEILLQPGARRDEVIGPHDGAIKIKIKAPPVDGAANAALVRFLSLQLKIPQKHIQILRGLTSKRKTIEISTELTIEQIQQKLAKPTGD